MCKSEFNDDKRIKSMQKKKKLKPVLIISPNPTLDFIFNEINYFYYSKVFYNKINKYAGGSGINVARALKSLDVPYILFSIFGGNAGIIAKLQLEVEGINHYSVKNLSETRVTAIEYNDMSKRMIVSNSPTFTNKVIKEFIELYSPFLKSSSLVLFGGSFPDNGNHKTQQNAFYSSFKEYSNKLLLDTRGSILIKFIDLNPFFVKADSSEFELSPIYRKNKNDSIICFEKNNKIIVYQQAQIYEYPNYGSPQIRSYGRGDSFVAGFIYGISSGYTVDFSIKAGIIAANSEINDELVGLGSIDKNCFFEAVKNELDKI